MKEPAILSASSTLLKGQGTEAHARVATIDILRALTMVLMIFVNDLWSLTNIPAWLGHVDAGVDGIGLADVVFPAFLFIVGLSIPYAIKTRRNKGDSDSVLIKHILWRTIALLTMGVFLVNGETINAEATGIPRYVWSPVCCLCFIAIWNTYPRKVSSALVMGLRGIAIAALIYLATIYRGGPWDDPTTFGPQWWGILGLIGWAYLVSAMIAVFSKESMYVILGSWIFFSSLSIVTHSGLFPEFLNFIPEAIRGGTLVALTLGGVLTSMVFRHFRDRKNDRDMTIVLLAVTALLVILSLVTRPYWGLAKLGATPAWLFLCSAFTIAAFLVVYWIADLKGKEHWFSFVKPAGVGTLLCYLVPHFAYFTTRALGIHLPKFMLTGAIGLLKSFLFALLCVLVTAILIRVGVRMKL